MGASFPLFLISFAIYNMIVFLTPGVSWADPLVSVPLYSGATWTVTFGDGLIGASGLFLLFSAVRAARGAGRSAFDHVLTILIFAGAVAEFVLVREAATSIFVYLLMLAFIDLVVGWAASARASRREVTIEQVPNNVS